VVRCTDPLQSFSYASGYTTFAVSRTYQIGIRNDTTLPKIELRRTQAGIPSRYRMQNVGVNAVGEMMRNDRETITVRHMDRERDVSWVVGNKTTEKQADCWEMRY